METQLKKHAGAELQTLDANIISSLVINGDLAKLSPEQKVQFYNYRCNQAGIDPAAKPFDLLRLNGKETLYANATCTQQLCANRGLSVTITNKEGANGLYMVWARVTDKEGRSTENMGAVPIDNLIGDALANAIMKAHTKATRRTVLAHCGLGMLDETETETIPNAQKLDMQNGHAQEVQAEEVPDMEQWADAVDGCNDLPSLGALYNQNKRIIEGNQSIKQLFTDRKLKLSA